MWNLLDILLFCPHIYCYLNYYINMIYRKIKFPSLKYVYRYMPLGLKQEKKTTTSLDVSLVTSTKFILFQISYTIFSFQIRCRILFHRRLCCTSHQNKSDIENIQRWKAFSEKTQLHLAPVSINYLLRSSRSAGIN